MNIRMPESCINRYRCGTDVAFWLNGSHPQIADGIVSRQACGSYEPGCCSRSVSIRVKACLGNYSVYEFVRPNTCNAAYCADVSSITPVIAPINVNSTPASITTTSITFDPCNVYSVLDNAWRSIYNGYSVYDDTLVEWNGWYRLYLQGKRAQIPELDWCVVSRECGGYTHPVPQDDIVTREIYVSYIDSSSSRQCNLGSRSNPIQVKACPGNYYVYRLIRPTLSLPMPTYCADVNASMPVSTTTTAPISTQPTTILATVEDPCNSYTVLDQPWRATNATRLWICDSKFNWNGWYRLLYYGMNIRMPESCINSVTTDITYDPCNGYSVLDNGWRSVYSGYTGHDDTLVEWNSWYRIYLQGQNAQIIELGLCASYLKCGGYTALYLGGSHPLPQDGIVTREIYEFFVDNQKSAQCISNSRSNPVQVKACPGNYFVYRLVRPALSLPMPTYCAVVFNIPSYDPCSNYTFLNQSWRGTNETGGSYCDSSLNWSGWYRLFYNGISVRMPESCVTHSRCGTEVSLWLNGSHPQLSDGIVTRGVCGNSGSDCCYHRSIPIQVKACPGNYYVYEFVKTSFCNTAYCAVVSPPAPNITVSTECQNNFTSQCGADLFNQIENITAQVLPPEVVTKYLDMVLNTQEKLLKVETTNPEKLVSSGKAVLNKTEKLVSTLVKPTETTYSVSISRNGLDIQVFAVGPKASMKEIPQLSLNSTQMEIDLIQISMNNNDQTRSAAVAFMSYANMGNMLSPNLFNTTNNTVKTMMSTVVSATLPKITNTRLTKPVNFTMKHIEEIEPNATLSCVYWKNTEWVEDGCYLLQTNSSHTVCSSEHLSTFALIMQINPPSGEASDSHLDLLSTVLVAVGLMFLSLTLLTFALCRRKLRVNNTPRINLCISLLLAHLLFLLTQSFLQYIQPDQLLCAVLAGVLHFLFLSAFVWMFIEAVLLFISVKNLTKFRSKQKEILGWKCLIVIGYIIPLVVVGVSVGLFPDGYGSEQCWIKTDRNFVWSFLGPVCFILTINVIIFVVVIFTLRSALARLNSDLSQIKQIKILVFKTLVQSAILGCPWILGFVIDGSKVLEMVFLFLNSQQGTFIFLVYCVLNQEIRQQYRKWMSSCCMFR
ncbi:uncharacterized protein [Salminus brasiliensis]|uniref:uncharacterized protein n=1 Tax=Salminus brasiliensis TaxID=930266 RepID=UPI003B8379BB